jgi:CHASE3 domain sensor protein
MTHILEVCQRDTGELGLILKELREFRKDNSQQLKDIREEINKNNTRIEEAERRIDVTETWL